MLSTSIRRRLLCLLPLLALSPSLAALPGALPVRSTETERYVALKDIARHYDLEQEKARAGVLGFVEVLLPGTKKKTLPPSVIKLLSPYLDMHFGQGSRQCFFNGTALWLHAPVVRVKREWCVTETDLRTTIDPLLDESEHVRELGDRVVVLDPGHGGKDQGTHMPSGAEEKDIVLDIAKRARVHLANAGVKVYLTRHNDRYLELTERCAKASDWNADLFISIHVNSAGNPEARGPETFVLTAPGYYSTSDGGDEPPDRERYKGHQFNGANLLLGYHVQRAVLDKTEATDRGIRHARFVVLREAPCPAALVECGFLTHPEEGGLLQDPAYREKLAQGITRGVLDYVTLIKRARVEPSEAGKY